MLRRHRFYTLFLGCALFFPIQLLVSKTTSAQTATFPQVKQVETQPLISQIKRLDQALAFLGAPLSTQARQTISELNAESDSASTSAIIQQLLDPRCLAAVEITSGRPLHVTPAPGQIPLIEQGWRPYLIKVINRSGSTGSLRVDSPNARPIPNAPADQVEKRWMGLISYSGQPLLSQLSGLELEYTIVQIFSHDAGPKLGEIDFLLTEESSDSEEVKPISRITRWTFEKSPISWQPLNQCELTLANEKLLVTMNGPDPFFTTEVTQPGGEMVLRFWAKFEKSGMGELFWISKNRPMFDGGRRVSFAIEPGRGIEYEVRFRAEEDITGLRIDPGNNPGKAEFDWISLENSLGSSNKIRAPFQFMSIPSHALTFRVIDFDGTPTTASFLIRDQEGRVYPAQSKRLAPDFFFQPHVYRSTGESVRLPNGTYTVQCARGPESISETKQLVIHDGSAELEYRVRRWIDPSQLGWWSGDHHIHAAGCLHYENPTQGVHPPDMIRHIMGEDLKVGCCLTWGPCFDFQKQFFQGKPDDVSRYPYLLRYDIEVSGFGSHASGHLNLLRLKEQIPPGGDSKNHWPTLGMNTLRWAKRQGAVCGPAHSGNGLTQYVGRVPNAVDGPNGVPTYSIPAYDGIGANEFIVQAALKVPGIDGRDVPAVDFISAMDTDRVAEWSMWYHVLNCGFRVRASGETDFPCISGDRVGMGRVYAKVEGKLDFDQWVQSIAEGRSYISDGQTHLMELEAHANTLPADKRVYPVGVNGSEIALDTPQNLTFTLLAAARYPGQKSVPIELIVNGLPVQTKELSCDGQVAKLQFNAMIEKSSWVAVRVFPHAHTNPFFVIVDDKPIRASLHSAQWCLAGVDQCWRTKERTYQESEKEQARLDYEEARRIYRQILDEHQPTK